MKQQLDWSIGIQSHTESVTEVKAQPLPKLKAKVKAKVKPAPALWRGQDVVALWHELLNQKWSEEIGCRSPQ